MLANDRFSRRFNNWNRLWKLAYCSVSFATLAHSTLWLGTYYTIILSHIKCTKDRLDSRRTICLRVIDTYFITGRFAFEKGPRAKTSESIDSIWVRSFSISAKNLGKKAPTKDFQYSKFSAVGITQSHHLYSIMARLYPQEEVLLVQNNNKKNGRKPAANSVESIITLLWPWYWILWVACFPSYYKLLSVGINKIGSGEGYRARVLLIIHTCHRFFFH